MIVAAILAGGQSQRMGRPKAFLSIDGQSLLDRVEKKISELTPTISQIVLSGKNLERESIPDEEPQRGPVGAIHTLAKKFLGKAEGLLVVPVDLPLLESYALCPLLQHFKQLRSSAVSYCDHPLPAVFTMNSELVEKSRTADSVRDLLGELRADQIFLEHPLCLTNTNTPEEWARATGDKE